MRQLTTLLPEDQPVVRWGRGTILRGVKHANGPTGGVLVGIPITAHWFTSDKDNAGSMCDTCLGFADDYRHLYDTEES